MENRFGLKDFVLLVLLVVVIVIQVLTMIQNDRQWPEIQSVRQQTREQTRELSDIRRLMERLVEQGITVAGTNSATNPSQAGKDPFERIEKAQHMAGYALGDWFIDSFPNIEKITPLASTDVYASDVQSRVQESLATRDPVTLEWLPLLARSWQIIAPPESAVQAAATQAAAGEDEEEAATGPSSRAAGTQAASTQPIVARGAVIRFQMRPNVRFSDGTPVTADDVVFTFQLIMNSAIEAPRQRAYYNKIASVEKTGDDEVTFSFKEPYFESFDLAGGMAILPKHFYSRFTPDQFNRSTGLLLGSGPYKLEDPENWAPGKPLQLLRNERYWGPPAPFERLVYRQIDNEVARMTTFRNGDLDLYNAQPEQYLSMTKDKDLVGRTQQHVYESPSAGYRYIAWNQLRGGQPTLFSDRRVRLAMTLLTDRQRICDQIMSGLATPNMSPFYRLSKQHDPKLSPWPYDADKAKSLLAEAGFKLGSDGVLAGPNGQPFRFKYTYPSGISNYEQVALFLKDAYARAGIILEPDPLDWSVFSERLKNKDFDAITLGWSGGIETDLFQMFHSSQMRERGDNFMSYRSERLDRLIEQARATIDESKRMPLWHQAEGILHEDQPYTFLFTRKQLVFMDKRVQNVQELPLGLNDLLEWFVPQPQQKWTKQ